MQTFAQKFALSTVIVSLALPDNIYYIRAKDCALDCTLYSTCVGMVTISTFEEEGKKAAAPNINVRTHAFLRLIDCLFVANPQQNSFHRIFPHSSIQYTAI